MSGHRSEQAGLYLIPTIVSMNKRSSTVLSAPYLGEQVLSIVPFFCIIHAKFTNKPPSFATPKKRKNSPNSEFNKAYYTSL